MKRGTLILIRYDDPESRHKSHKMYRLVHTVVKIEGTVYVFVSETEHLVLYKKEWTMHKAKQGKITYDSTPVKSVSVKLGW